MRFFFQLSPDDRLLIVSVVTLAIPFVMFLLEKFG
jgi:hypothetical protein